MDAVAFKIALTKGTEDTLAQLRVQLARRAAMVRFGLSDGLFRGAQAVEAQKGLAHFEGEISGIEAYFHFVQTCLDTIIEHENTERHPA